ncbi:MAG: hypothetical protein HY606_01460 [Planctomycetes bacterium]|nr:hypothetical protein [Planctomycetota bacterium]
MKKVIPLIVMVVVITAVVILKQQMNQPAKNGNEPVKIDSKTGKSAQTDKKINIHNPITSPNKEIRSNQAADEHSTKPQGEIGRTVTINGTVTDKENNPLRGNVRILLMKELQQNTSSKTESKTISVNEDGKFSDEIEYNGFEGERFILYAGTLGPMMPNTSKTTRLSSTSDNAAEIIKMFTQATSTFKHFFKIQQFILTEIHETVNVTLQITQTATLTIEANVQEKPADNPSDILRIGSFSKFRSGPISEMSMMMQPFSRVTIKIYPEGYSWKEIDHEDSLFKGTIPDFVEIGKSSEIEVPADVKITVVCTYRGHADKTEVVGPLMSGENKFIRLFLEKASGTFSGTCMNEEGQPIAGVLMSLKQDGLSNVRAVSIQDGTFTFNEILNTEILEIRFSHNDYEDLILKKINIGVPVSAVLKKMKKVSIKGRCVDKNGVPVVNVQIHCIQGSKFPSASSDQNGYFELQVAEGTKINSVGFYSSNHKYLSLNEVSLDKLLNVTLQDNEQSEHKH